MMHEDKEVTDNLGQPSSEDHSTLQKTKDDEVEGITALFDDHFVGTIDKEP